VRDALEGGFYNKGEACTATSRILVRDGLADRDYVYVWAMASIVYRNSSSSAFASCRSRVAKPSVNQA